MDKKTEPDFNSDQHVPVGLLDTIKLALKRYGFLGTLSRYLMMIDEGKKFIKDGGSKKEQRFRKELIRKFKNIQKNVTCAHSPFQFILMAEYLLTLNIKGPIVQCGCFKGGSSAKLSIIAKKLNRRLYICDSFEGLPEPSDNKENVLTSTKLQANYALASGQYEGTLEEVKENIRKYGVLEVCEFVPGWVKDSLPKLNISPAFVFIDVDYISSARDCLKHLWPKLKPGGYWFTHEASFKDYILGIMESKWWQENLNMAPPTIIGGGSGLSELAPAIAYFQKYIAN